MGVAFCWPAWCSIDPWCHSIHLHPSLWSLLSHPGSHVMVTIGRLPVEVGGLSHYLQGSIHPKGVCLEFLPSTACLKSASCQPADTYEKRCSTCHVVTTQCTDLSFPCIEVSKTQSTSGLPLITAQQPLWSRSFGKPSLQRNTIF